MEQELIINIFAIIFASGVSAIVTLKVSTEKFRNLLHETEIQDRTSFRHDLLQRIEKLEADLNHCQSQHIDAQKEISSLVIKVRELESEIAKLEETNLGRS